LAKNQIPRGFKFENAPYSDKAAHRANKEKVPWPYRLAFCEHEDGRLLKLDNAQQDEPALLLFMSPYHAGDYLMHTNTTARLYGVHAESLSIEVAKWLRAGLCKSSDVVLNRARSHFGTNNRLTARRSVDERRSAS
jgi:hypothetical protein